MQAFIRRYLNEVISLAVMFLMIVALIHAQAVIRPSMTIASAEAEMQPVAAKRAP